ncbi:MAG: hypothetical protein ACPGU5_01495 [Lishizhenia sp.]
MKKSILLITFLISLTGFAQYPYNVNIKVKEKKCSTKSSLANVQFKIYASNAFGDILYKVNHIKVSVLKEGETEFSFVEHPNDFDTLLSPAKYIVNIHDSTYQPPIKVKQLRETNGIDRIDIIQKSMRIQSIYAGTFTVKDSFSYVVKILIPENMLNSMFQEPQIQLLKPVIYMYSDLDLTTKLSLKIKGNLTFSYPEYKSQWEVEIKNNQLYVADKKYPYLFWEGSRSSSFQITEGAVVSKENLLNYLELSCDKLGLNMREKTDFITFWYPRLHNYDFLKLQFLDTEAYKEQVAEISFSKTPETLQRIYLLAQPCEENEGLEPQRFEKLNRKGFTVIEWGGSILPKEAHTAPKKISLQQR